MAEAASAGWRRIVHPTDAVVSAVLVVGGLVLWRETNNFEEVPDLFSQNLSPDLFPKMLLVCIIALALILPFEHLLVPGGKAQLDGGRKAPVKPKGYLVIAVVTALLAGMPYLGAILSLYAIALVMPLVWGERRLFAVIAFAALFPSAVVLLFGFLLGVHMDPGSFGIGLY